MRNNRRFSEKETLFFLGIFMPPLLVLAFAWCLVDGIEWLGKKIAAGFRLLKQKVLRK